MKFLQQQAEIRNYIYNSQKRYYLFWQKQNNDWKTFRRVCTTF